MPNLNGTIIVQTLMTVKEPATMKQIVELIAESALVAPEEVKASIIYILKKGVRYGFIQRSRGRYYIEEMGELVSAAVNKSCLAYNRIVEKRMAERAQTRSQKRRNSN